MADLVTLQNTLGVSFKDLSLLQEPLVHRSYLNENPDPPFSSNERLEFLGDAVLNFVIAQELYEQFPSLDEGGLTKLRAELVCTETLANRALSLQLGDYLYLGRGEEQSGGRDRQRNLAGALEAIAGAILIDRGFVAAKEFILRLLGDQLKLAAENRLTTDSKSSLQELVQASQQATPVYRTVAMTGPDHAKEFTVEVLVGDTIIGRGVGKSKKLAEKEAAQAALQSLENRDSN